MYALDYDFWLPTMFGGSLLVGRLIEMQLIKSLIGIGIAALILIPFLVVFGILHSINQSNAGCSRDNFSVSSSPDNEWNAFLSEEVCADGAFVTTVVYTVQLVRRGDEPNLARNTPQLPEGDVFAMDWFRDSRPDLEWLSPRKLQITAPNISFIGLQKQEYEGIRIAVKFNSDDPTARQKFREDRGLK